METKIKTEVKDKFAKKIANQFDKATDKLVDAKNAIYLLEAEDNDLWQYYTLKIEELISDMCNEWTKYHNKAYGIEIDNKEPY